MANPAVKNGHLDIANELVQKFSKIHLSGNEWQIIWSVWRKTWCWKEGDKKKDFDWISLSQLENLTELNRVAVCRSKKSLVSKMILLEKNGKIGLNQDYSQWVVSKMTLVSKTAMGSVKNGNGGSVKNDTYKRYNIKDTNTKEMHFSLNSKKNIPLGEIVTGDEYIPDFICPKGIKIDKKNNGSEFGRKCIWLGYKFDEGYFKRFGEHYKKGNFSVSGISKNISKYTEFKREEWIKIIEFYFKSRKSKELVVTIEACLSENTIMEYKQKTKKLKYQND